MCAAFLDRIKNPLPKFDNWCSTEQNCYKVKYFQIFVEEPNSKPCTKKSKRSSIKFKFPFRNGSNGKQSMSFLFTLYLLFVSYAKIDVYWILSE